MQYLLLAAIAVGIGALVFSGLQFLSPESTEEALSDALLEELSEDIRADISVKPTETNPVAISDAKASEVITELQRVLEKLQERNVSVANPLDLEKDVQRSVEDIIAADDEPSDSRLDPLEESLAASIAENIEAIKTPIAQSISEDDLSEAQRAELTNEILDSVLRELAENDVPPERDAEAEIAGIVDEVVAENLARPEFRDAVEDERELKDELTQAVSGLGEELAEDVPDLVGELQPAELNDVAEAVAEQVADASVPDVTEQIVEEGLDPANPEDRQDIEGIVEEEVTRAIQEVLPEGDPRELESLAREVQQEQHAAIRENDEDLATAPKQGGEDIWDLLAKIGAAWGAILTVTGVLLGFVGPQFWSPRISVGGVLLPRSPNRQTATDGGSCNIDAHTNRTSRKIHKRSDAPLIAFKLAFAASRKAILEGIEFRERLGFLASIMDFADRSVDAGRRLFGGGSRRRHWVRAHDAQQIASDPRGQKPRQFKDLALPMVLNPGDQLFIRATAWLADEDEPSDEEVKGCHGCNGGDDECPDVEMIALKLRGNIRAYSFRIEHWEEQDFPRRRLNPVALISARPWNRRS